MNINLTHAEMKSLYSLLSSTHLHSDSLPNRDCTVEVVSSLKVEYDVAMDIMDMTSLVKKKLLNALVGP